MQKIKNLYAFDFDDTLAVTPSIIGVQRVGKDGKADPNFREWIHENNIDFHDIENPGSDSEIVWFTSGDFAKYEKAHKNDIEYLELNFLKDQYDFTKTASIDVDASLPINTMMSILKKAYSEPNSRGRGERIVCQCGRFDPGGRGTKRRNYCSRNQITA